MNSRPKSERFMKFLKDNISYCLCTFMVAKDFFKKRQKTQTIRINTGNFNYIKILFSQNFCFAEQTKPI